MPNTNIDQEKVIVRFFLNKFQLRIINNVNALTFCFLCVILLTLKKALILTTINYN